MDKTKRPPKRCKYCQRQFYPWKPTQRFCSFRCRSIMQNGTVRQRVLAKIGPVLENGCCHWQGEIGSRGYGKFYLNKRAINAHRMVFSIFVHPLRDNDVVCHQCDNPACVNIDHLFVGTQADNVADMLKKGRANHPRGERNYFAKLSEDQARTIKFTNSDERHLAEKFGVSIHCVRQIRNGRNWKHV